MSIFTNKTQVIDLEPCILILTDYNNFLGISVDLELFTSNRTVYDLFGISLSVCCKFMRYNNLDMDFGRSWTINSN